MADRKAVNKYYPPEWTPDKGSINKFRGTHALRERARKLDQGILIIRFEMPYNIWCEGCKNHIGMGVRYNAEKSKVGNYYTTTIWKFKFKCHLCDNYIEMKTDPANFDYVIVSGASRQERRWDPSENEQIAPEDKEVGKKLVTDAMFRLQHDVDDKGKSKATNPSLTRLEDHKEKWRDDYTTNQLLRQKFREKKTTINEAKATDEALLKKASLNIELLPESEDDKRLAQLYKLTPGESSDEKQKKKRESIKNRPLFWDVPKTSNMQSSSQDTLKNLTVQAMEMKLSSRTKPLSSQDIGVTRKKMPDIAKYIVEKTYVNSEVEMRTSLCGYSTSEDEDS